MSLIKEIHAKSIQASNGRATISVSIITDEGIETVYKVPTEKKVSIYGAVELRDPDDGVTSAVDMIRDVLAPGIIGMDIEDQSAIDEKIVEIDGTDTFSKIGSNTAIGISMAVFKASSLSRGLEHYEYARELADIKPSQETPNLLINMIDGGRNAEDGVMFEEHMIMPEAISAERSYHIARVIKSSLEELIFNTSSRVEVGEGMGGGFIFPISSPEEAFEFLKDAIHRAGVDEEVRIICGSRASALYVDGMYEVDSRKITKNELLDIYRDLSREQSVWGFEDPFIEDEYIAPRELKESLRDSFLISNDSTSSDIARIEGVVKNCSYDALVIKPEQAGTVSMTLQAIKKAREYGLEVILSSMTEETDEDVIADLAYAFGCFGLKAGGVDMPESVAKYKRLIEISG